MFNRISKRQNNLDKSANLLILNSDSSIRSSFAQQQYRKQKISDVTSTQETALTLQKSRFVAPFNPLQSSTIPLPLSKIDEPSESGESDERNVGDTPICEKMKLENLPFELVTPVRDVRESQGNILLDVDEDVPPKFSDDPLLGFHLEEEKHRDQIEIRQIEESQSVRQGTPEPEPTMTPRNALQI